MTSADPGVESDPELDFDPTRSPTSISSLTWTRPGPRRPYILTITPILALTLIQPPSAGRYGGVVERPAVAEGADWFVSSHDELRDALSKHNVAFIGSGAALAALALADIMLTSTLSCRAHQQSPVCSTRTSNRSFPLRQP